MLQSQTLMFRERKSNLLDKILRCCGVGGVDFGRDCLFEQTKKRLAPLPNEITEKFSLEHLCANNKRFLLALKRALPA